jgi:hypothetical protein
MRRGERLDERLLLDAKGTDTLPLLEFSLEKLFDDRRIVTVDDHQEAHIMRLADWMAPSIRLPRGRLLAFAAAT